MYYVFNEIGTCIGCCNYEVDSRDLASRNEVVIESKDNYDTAKIKLENGSIITIVPSLDELKKTKWDEVNKWTERKITGGFISNASGSPVTYDSDKDTQLTMQGIALNVNTPLFTEKYPDGCPVRGYAEGEETKSIFMLNPEQVMLWCADLSMHIGNCKQAGWVKQAEVQACTTVEELDAIVLD